MLAMKRMISMALSAVLLAAVSPAQSQAPSSIKSKVAVDVTAAQIQSILKLDNPTQHADRLAKVVDAGPYNFSVNVQHRVKGQVTDDRGTMHSKIGEIYYVLDGSATLVTGGTMVNPQSVVYDAKLVTPEGGNSTGPGYAGIVKKPYVTRKIGPGDVVFIPPMTNHWFSSVEDHIDYLSFRVDPDHVLPAGYTFPTLKSAK